MSKRELKRLSANSNNRLYKNVAYTILDNENPECFISDLLQHGCVSGMVGSLIYYNDTVKFYNKFQMEIDELLKNMLSETGYHSPAELFGKNWDNDDPLARDTMNQNLLAWFGFEETARQIAYDLNMDI